MVDHGGAAPTIWGRRGGVSVPTELSLPLPLPLCFVGHASAVIKMPNSTLQVLAPLGSGGGGGLSRQAL